MEGCTCIGEGSCFCAVVLRLMYLQGAVKKEDLDWSDRKAKRKLIFGSTKDFELTVNGNPIKCKIHHDIQEYIGNDELPWKKDTDRYEQFAFFSFDIRYNPSTHTVRSGGLFSKRIEVPDEIKLDFTVKYKGTDKKDVQRSWSESVVPKSRISLTYRLV